MASSTVSSSAISETGSSYSSGSASGPSVGSSSVVSSFESSRPIPPDARYGGPARVLNVNAILAKSMGQIDLKATTNALDAISTASGSADRSATSGGDAGQQGTSSSVLDTAEAAIEAEANLVVVKERENPFNAAFGALTHLQVAHAEESELDPNDNACRVVPRTNAIRRGVRAAVKTEWFELFVAMVVVINMVALALVADEDGDTGRQFEFIFMGLYTLEMLLKWLAFGIVLGTTSYLNKGWSLFEFVMLIVGWVSLLPGLETYRTIRALRALRGLRMARFFRGARVIVEAATLAIGALLNVITIILFAFIIFAVVGMELWAGLFQQACVTDRGGELAMLLSPATARAVGIDSLVAAPICSTSPDWGLQCPTNSSCHVDVFQADYGFTGYDNVGMAMLTVLRVFSLDNWAVVSFKTAHAWSNYAHVFYLALVIFSIIYGLNFILLVLYDYFSDISWTTLTLLSREVKKSKIHIYGVARTTALEFAYKQHLDDDVDAYVAAVKGEEGSAADKTANNIVDALEASRALARESSSTGSPRRSRSARSVSTRGLASTSQPLQSTSPSMPMSTTTSSASTEATSSSGGSASGSSYYSEQEEAVGIGSSDVTDDTSDDAPVAPPQGGVSKLRSELLGSCGFVFDRFKQPYRVVMLEYIKNKPKWFGAIARALDSNLLSLAINVLILGNFVVLALRSYDKEDGGVLDILNIVFWAIFALEMVLKIVFFSPIAYFSERWNLLDVLVVIFGIIELVVDRTGLSAFRLFRLFRLFGNFRFSKESRYAFKSLVAIRRSFQAAFNVVVFMVVMVFTFALCGMILFSGRMVPDSAGLPPQTSFDTLWQAIISVFVILTGKGWVDIMYSVMRVDTSVGAVFALVVYFLGNLVIVNLFICVLMMSWEQTVVEFDVAGEDNVNLGAKADVDSDKVTGGLYAQREALLKTEDASMPLHLAKHGYTGRKTLPRIVFHPVFDVVVDVLIVVSVAFVFLETNDGSSSGGDRSYMLDVIDVVIMGLLIIEVVLRLLVYQRRKLLEDRFFRLDMIVLLSSVVRFVLMLSGIPARILITLRVLRASRVVSRLRAARIMLYSLRRAVLRLFLGPTLVLLVLWSTFAILGMRLFGGMMGECKPAGPAAVGGGGANATTTTMPPSTACPNLAGGAGDVSELLNRTACESACGSWKSSTPHFDAFGPAMLAMFQVVAKVEWSPVMFRAMDTVDVDVGMERNARPAAGLFFVVFMIAAVFFVVPLFLSIIIDTFKEVAAELPGTIFISHALRPRRRRDYLIATTAPRRSEIKGLKKMQTVRGPFHRAVSHPIFELAIVIVILANTVVLFFSHHNMDDGFADTLTILNYVFVGIYLVEAVFKILALGGDYFRSSWNLFDFIILILSIVGIVLELADVASVTLSVFRVLRVLRVFRLVGNSGKFYVIVLAMIDSLPAVLACMLPVFIMISMAASFAVSVYGPVGALEAVNGEFSTWTESFFLLFRVVTTDAALSVLTSMEAECVGVDDCRVEYLPIIIVLLIIIFTFALRAVFTYIVFDAYGEALLYSRLASKLELLREFRERWADEDPEFTNHVSVKTAIDIFNSLSEPLDFRHPLNAIVLLKYKIPVTNDLEVQLLPAFSAFAEILLHQELSFPPDSPHLYTKGYDLGLLLKAGILDKIEQVEDDAAVSFTMSDSQSLDYTAAQFVEMRGVDFGVFIEAQWKLHDQDEDATLSYDELVGALDELNIVLPEQLMRDTFRTYSNNNILTKPQFARFMQSLALRDEISEVFRAFAAADRFMTAHEFQHFLLTEQGATITNADLLKVIELLMDTPARTLTQAAFQRFLTSNGATLAEPIAVRPTDDMTQPMTAYWINSSHNTYLEGDQYKSKSSAEQYAKVLDIGCRCVELDCWDGDDGNPVIFHGHTLTDKVKFLEVIEAIRDHAFTASEYPVILSLEVHCHHEQQDVMARMMTEVFGDMIYDVEAWRAAEVMPSPEECKRKIIIKGKSADLVGSGDGSGSGSGGYESYSSTTDPGAVVRAQDGGGRSSASDGASASDTGGGGGKVKVKKIKWTQALSAMIHLKSVHFDGYDAPRPLYGMSSFKESKIAKLARKDAALYAQHCHDYVARIYPAGHRVDSSNYSPQMPWTLGAQLVALNFQTTDVPMIINRGKFLANANTGYVLKPPRLHTDGDYLDLIEAATNLEKKNKGCMARFRKRTINHEPSFVINVKVISGAYLPKCEDEHVVAKAGSGSSTAEDVPVVRGIKEVVDPYVDVGVAGVGVDDAVFRTEVMDNNGFNPVWNEEFEFGVHYPDVSILYFVVSDSDELSSDEMLAYYALPLSMVRKGYRSVPLFHPKTHALLPHASLFVHISYGRSDEIGGDSSTSV